MSAVNVLDVLYAAMYSPKLSGSMTAELSRARDAVMDLIQTSALLDAELEAAWKNQKIPHDATSASTVNAFKGALARIQGGES